MLCHRRSRIRLVVGKKIGHFTYFDARQVHMDAEEPGALKVPSLDGFGRDQPAAAGPFMNQRPKIRGVRCREAERSRNPGPSRDLGCTSRPTQACSLRKPTQQAGKTRLRLIVPGTPRGGPHPHALSLACVAFFVRLRRPASTVFFANRLRRAFPS
jgi:hypothetical protein